MLPSNVTSGIGVAVGVTVGVLVREGVAVGFNVLLGEEVREGDTDAGASVGEGFAPIQADNKYINTPTVKIV
jgi:hypothetical protein